MKSYIVASTKTWNIAAFAARRSCLPGRWIIVTDPNDLTIDLILRTAPRYIFFMHWSEIVPEEITKAAECVCFHMSDVPFGRGGSPLQNLISRGQTETKLTALRMTGAVDSGPVYGKLPMHLGGSAQDIFNRSALLGLDLIDMITRVEPIPAEQVGEPVVFKRRRPEQSRLPESGSLHELYDHIRMLDAETYPPAFVDHGNFRITFSDAEWTSNSACLLSKAKIFVRRPDGGS
jgi:methionyl-tRNA formyltransferase